MAKFAEKYSLIGTLSENCETIILSRNIMMKRFLKSLVGQDLQIDLEKVKKIRSASQNRYYWGLMIKMICQHHLETQGSALMPNDAHYYNLTKVLQLSFKEQIIFGNLVLVFEDAKSTSEMTTVEFNDFIRLIQQHFVEHYDLIIPDPNQQNFLNQIKLDNESLNEIQKRFKK